MRRCVGVIVGVLAAAAPAAADPGATPPAEPARLELGGLLGPHFFASDAALGHRPGGDLSLRSSILIGVRAARPFLPWLVLEAELPITGTTTNQYDVQVFWMSPRAHARFDVSWPGPFKPFVVTGLGLPVTLSSKRGLFASDVTFDLYTGGGVQFFPGHALNLRLDVRVGLVPARGDAALTTEFELAIGAWIPLGGGPASGDRAEGPADRDGDHVADAADACPDRAEDADGFADADGCPDIDNDGDRVLDVADRCPVVAETFNGFEDDDGCPDTVAPEVDEITGDLEILYNSGEVDVSPSADGTLDEIAGVLEKYPSVRLVLVGHSDDREAVAARGDDAAEAGAAADPAAAAVELSRRRAAEVARALVQRGIAAGRLDVTGAGMESPVSSNATPRARLRNRRVEVKLFVPLR